MLADGIVQISGDQSFGEWTLAALAHSNLLEGPTNGL